jgi:hypothetical protein
MLTSDACPPPADTTATPDVIALIAGLLREQMGFPLQPPRVFIYNENWKLPQTTVMFLLVSLLNAQIYGAGSGYAIDATGENLMNQQQLARANIVTVDALSESTEARLRLPEVFFALQGDASERLAERYNLSIFRPTDFVDLSGLEASRRLNRFQTQFSVFQSTGQSRQVPSMTAKKPFVGKFLIQP